MTPAGHFQYSCKKMGFCRSCGLTYPEGHAFCPLDGTQLSEPDDPFLGKVVAGKYRVVSLIGEGGMGIVYAAQHVHVDRKVAVKVLPRELSRDREVKERFLREARAALATLPTFQTPVPLV